MKLKNFLSKVIRIKVFKLYSPTVTMFYGKNPTLKTLWRMS